MAEWIGGIVIFAVGFMLAASASNTRKVKVTVRSVGPMTTTEIDGRPDAVAETVKALGRGKSDNVLTARETIQ